MICFSTTPPPPLPVSKLDRRHTGRLRKRDNLLTGERRKGVGEEPNTCDHKKAWSSINHSILSGLASAVTSVPPLCHVHCTECVKCSAKIKGNFSQKVPVTLARWLCTDDFQTCWTSTGVNALINVTSQQWKLPKKSFNSQLIFW